MQIKMNLIKIKFFWKVCNSFAVKRLGWSIAEILESAMFSTKLTYVIRYLNCLGVHESDPFS